MNWLAQNSETLSLLISAGTLLVWMTYLQVFLRSYRRQTKPMILISLGSGHGLEATCLVTNMGASAIYIHAMIVRLTGPNGTVSWPVTELEDAEDWQGPTDLQLWSRQGPLQPGQVRDMGTLEQVVGHLRRIEELRGTAPADGDLERIEIDVVGFQASEVLPVAATQAFDVSHDATGPSLRPTAIAALQIDSRRRRRKLKAALHQHLRHGSTRTVDAIVHQPALARSAPGRPLRHAGGAAPGSR